MATSCCHGPGQITVGDLFIYLLPVVKLSLSCIEMFIVGQTNHINQLSENIKVVFTISDGENGF